jgi:hypothetical protein
MNEFCIENFLEKSFENEKNNCINKSTINKINSLFNLNLNINIQKETINTPLKLERYGPLDELFNNYIFSKKNININDIKNIIKYFNIPGIFI